MLVGMALFKLGVFSAERSSATYLVMVLALKLLTKQSKSYRRWAINLGIISI